MFKASRSAMRRKLGTRFHRTVFRLFKTGIEPRSYGRECGCSAKDAWSSAAHYHADCCKSPSQLYWLGLRTWKFRCTFHCVSHEFTSFEPMTNIDLAMPSPCHAGRAAEFHQHHYIVLFIHTECSYVRSKEKLRVALTRR
jgi:hypothetical protein